MRYATRIERFGTGDYPAVCVRSGLPADTWVPVEAARRSPAPWFFFPLSILTWLFSWFLVDRQRRWGWLPFATGHVGGFEARWEKRQRVVVLTGVHPAFAEPCRHEQQRAGA